MQLFRIPKEVLFFLVFSLVVSITISCAPSKKKMTIEAGRIPPGIKGFNGTLLIIDGNQKSWNKYMTKNFDKHYKGKYAIVSQSELLSTYSDVTIYRFVLYRNSRLSVNRYTGAVDSRAEKLCMRDRALGAEFCSKLATNFAILIKNYSIALEKARSGN